MQLPLLLQTFLKVNFSCGARPAPGPWAGPGDIEWEGVEEESGHAEEPHQPLESPCLLALFCASGKRKLGDALLQLPGNCSHGWKAPIQLGAVPAGLAGQRKALAHCLLPDAVQLQLSQGRALAGSPSALDPQGQPHKPCLTSLSKMVLKMGHPYLISHFRGSTFLGLSGLLTLSAAAPVVQNPQGCLVDLSHRMTASRLGALLGPLESAARKKMVLDYGNC